MKEKRFEILISSCQKYADLWQGNILLLNRNWSDRNAATYLVTDEQTNISFPGVTILCAGSGLEFTQRLAFALENLSAEYVLLTLEDYYFTRPIQGQAVENALDFMDRCNVDYLQLYPQPAGFLRRDGAKEAPGYPGFYFVDTHHGQYKVVLTPGLWRRDFLRKTLQDPMNPWEYEVSLTAQARELGAVCATSNRGEMPYLDVIRKGKVLPSAAAYFRKEAIYSGSRPVMSRWQAWVLDMRTFLKFYLPAWMLRILKRWMGKLGCHFYTPTE